MAIAFDAHTASGVNTFNASVAIASPQTFSHTTGSGSNRLLVVTIEQRGGGGGIVTGVTYNGVSMTQVTTEAISGSAHCTIFYLVNPASGSNIVSISHNWTGGGHMVASATSLSGVNQTSPLNVSSKAAASSAGPMTTSLTTTVDDCWVIDSCAMRTQAGETATMTTVTNRTSRTNLNTTSAGLRGLVSTLGPAGVAGSKTMEWTKTLNHDWAIMAAAFAPATGYTLTAAGGSYSITGTAATLKVSRVIGAGSGSYAITGTAAQLKRGLRLAGGVGSYSIAGTAASLKRGLLLTAAAGTYGITGTATALLLSRKIAAGSGSYAITGVAASFAVGSNIVTLTASPGAYTITGGEVWLRYYPREMFRRVAAPDTVTVTAASDPLPVATVKPTAPATATPVVNAAPAEGAFTRSTPPDAVTINNL